MRRALILLAGRDDRGRAGHDRGADAEDDATATGEQSARPWQRCAGAAAARSQSVRKATAIVNSAIITDTDVDQRLALVLAASGGKISR
jgi:hypothetical protein